MFDTARTHSPASVAEWWAPLVLLPADLVEAAGGPDSARRMRRELADVTEQLVSEYQDLLPPGTVLRTVARQVLVARDQGVATESLSEVVAARARVQLHERVHHGGAIDLRDPLAVARTAPCCACPTQVSTSMTDTEDVTGGER